MSRDLPPLRGLYWAPPGTYAALPCLHRKIHRIEAPMPERVTFGGFFLVKCHTYAHDAPISSAPRTHYLDIGPEMGKCPGYKLACVYPELLRADRCAACGTVSDELVVCTGCGTHSYCDVACEQAHCEVHNEWCEEWEKGNPLLEYEPGVDRCCERSADLKPAGRDERHRNRRARRRRDRY